MVSSSAPLTVIRVLPGPGTGDTTYVVQSAAGNYTIHAPCGSTRVTVVESGKLGPTTKIRVKR